MERKSIIFELKELDKGKRVATIAHAAYDNIDFTRDISRKGMFNKSWSESKENISFYLNHNDEQAPGKVTNVHEDKDFAYTDVWLGTHTLGNDVLTMMDEGVIKKASFGYITQKANKISVKGQNVRELKEVHHIETSVLTKMPANIKAGVMSVTKAFDGLTAVQITEFKQHLDVLEKFCRNTKASDGCIKNMLTEIDNYKNVIAEYNTASTATQPDASVWSGWFK